MNRGCVRSANVSLGSEKFWPAYNLFRHKLMPDLFCAVPQDWPVPGFIEGSAWAFAGTLRAPRRPTDDAVRGDARDDHSPIADIRVSGHQ